MNKIASAIKDVRFTDKTVPWFLLLACLFAFGPLLPRLGFYQDDWNVVYNYFRYGPDGILDLFQFDGRPFASWIYLVGFPLLGYKPLAWHIAALVMRWLTSVILWLVFRMLWPRSSWQNLAASLIFVLYPFFTLQPLAATYIHHWTGYFLYAISIYLMIQATRTKFWLNTMLALVLQALHLLTLEFYAGIDLLRPVLLWLAFAPLVSDGRQRFKAALLRWAPYLVVFILFFVWRGFFYQAAVEGRNDPVGLAALLVDPLTTSQTILANALPDYGLVLVASWYNIFEPNFLNFNISANRLIILISALSAGIFFFYQSRHLPGEKDPTDSPAAKQMLAVGILALLLGLLPAYGAGFVIHTKIPPWNSRFSLGSLYGAALIVTATLDYLITVPRRKWILSAILLGLLAGWHLHYTNDFRWAWDKQLDFYRQLSLRAPSIQPGTVLLSEEEFLGFMGDYPTALGINTLYATRTETSSREATYWFQPLSKFQNEFENYLNGTPIEVQRASTTFQGNSRDALVVLFQPENNQCLWILAPEQAHFQQLSRASRDLAMISDPGRIKQSPRSDSQAFLAFLDPNPPQDWCYYYERADLASQFEQWRTTIDLWNAAQEAGLRPANGFEYLPFIKAYAHNGEWATALTLTRTASKTSNGMTAILCNTWVDLQEKTPASELRESAFADLVDSLDCEP